MDKGPVRLLVLALVGILYAGDGTARDFLGFNYSTSGVFRVDAAVSTTSELNFANQFGNPYNEHTVQRVPGNPALPATGIPVVDGLDPLVPPYSIPLTPFADTFERPVDLKGNTFNYHVARFDGELKVNLTSNLRFVGRIRSLYNVDEFDASFDARAFANEQGNIGSPVPDIYTEEPNHFEYQVVGDKNPQPLEFAGEDYFVDFPALLFEYSTGATTLRVGNQQIAWGQTIFFRILDKVDGLDLRRHLILDRALEEFSDERVPALGVRATTQITNSVLADAFVQKFQPRIIPNPNTPYSFIPAQFTIHDRYAADGYDDELNFGLRLKGDYGKWGWQALAIRRYNPAGTFRWTESGVNRNLPNSNPLGVVFNNYCVVALGSTSGGCGDIIEHIPFSVDPTGTAVGSGHEIAYYAAQTRLNGLGLLNNAATEFPAAQDLLAAEVSDHESFLRELDTFFIASGGMRGHIARDYHRENVFGLGGSYVTEAEMGSFFNQIIFNLELAYTPDKTFSDPGASQEPLVEDEWEVGLVVEKYHRVIKTLPSTLMVLQYLYRSTSDIFDRHLSGYGAGTSLDTTADESIPPGRSNAQYAAIALLQPTAAYIHEFSLAALVDLGGGVYIQPGYRWKPRGDIAVEIFYNFIDGDTFGDPNDNTLSSFDYADEASVRLSYEF